ncbi:MAG: nickel pincer cofactor biosynthesis protein LarC [Actinomycetota bacterium]|nr:nickel pincer cofactor biosynthesis protein LarC [Actinomycetota bacterium]
MTLAWFSCEAGASGDMLLGALVDAGAPLEAVQAAVAAVGVEPVLLSADSVTRQGLAATKVDVAVPHTGVVRTWASLRGLLEDADLVEPVRARALDVFARLARAEAVAHGISPEQVHFHEVGALDAVADVVGTAAALDALGVHSVAAGPVALGSGVVRGAHGLVPVPGPAVLALLTEAGAIVHSGEAPYELCTPTGAALLASVVQRWGGLPPVRITATGTGAGSRDLEELPNVLRVVLGEPAVPEDEPGGTDVLLATNVDDLDPRLWPPVLARLLSAGAADAWLTPVLMKKGRPAHTLSVLTPAAALPAVRRIVFTETSAIGVREHPVTKQALDRDIRSVTVDGCPVRVKLARLDGKIVNLQPEYDDVAAAAAVLRRPAKAVLAAALAAAAQAGWT